VRQEEGNDARLRVKLVLPVSYRIAFMGHGEHGAIVLRQLVARGLDIVGILLPRKSDSTKRVLVASEVPPSCHVASSAEMSPVDIAHWLRDRQADAVLVCAYPDKVPPEVLEFNPVHIHGGILPGWRGRNLLNWVLVKGVDKSGLSLHLMEGTLDTGDVIGVVEYTITPEDDVNSVRARMYDSTPELLDRFFLPYLDGCVKPWKQDHGKARYYPARGPEDGRICWSANAVDAYNLVRALVRPFPGAFCFSRGRRMVIERGEVQVDNTVRRRGGQVVEIGGTGLFTVAMGYNSLVVLEVRNPDVLVEGGLKRGEWLE
jgi:methionyl-tRNA formyltransferase